MPGPFAIEPQLTLGELPGVERVHGFHDSAGAGTVIVKQRRRAKFSYVVLLSCALGSAVRDARANGRFPEANQVVFDPSEPEHLLVRTTFGLLESRDGAKSFSWTCESALELSGEADPMLAITASGAQVAATFSGIRRSADGCSYQSPSELAGQIVAADLALDPSEPRRLLAFRTTSLGGGLFDSALARSEDEGLTWELLEPPLPREVLPLSVDLTATAASRVYLTGRLGAASQYVSVLLRSDDAGQHFEQFTIPGSEQQEISLHRRRRSHRRGSRVRARGQSARHPGARQRGRG